MSALRAASEVTDPIVQVRQLSKIFGHGQNQVKALDQISVDIERGSFTTIMGPSGSGKSTFMHCVAGLDAVTDGQITVDGIQITDLSERKLTKIRREHIGFVFQSFNLIPTLTAKENITLPLDISHKKVDQDFFNSVVESLELSARLKHKPAELSGGQQQRVACARALLQKPAVLFADEPTGNLDSASSEQVMRYLRRAVDQFGQTVVMVTHEPDAAAWADKVLFLQDGQLVGELPHPDRATVLQALGELTQTHAHQPKHALGGESAARSNVELAHTERGRATGLAAAPEANASLTASPAADAPLTASSSVNTPFSPAVSTTSDQTPAFSAQVTKPEQPLPASQQYPTAQTDPARTAISSTAANAPISIAAPTTSDQPGAGITLGQQTGAADPQPPRHVKPGPVDLPPEAAPPSPSNIPGNGPQSTSGQ